MKWRDQADVVWLRRHHRRGKGSQRKRVLQTWITRREGESLLELRIIKMGYLRHPAADWAGGRPNKKRDPLIAYC